MTNPRLFNSISEKEKQAILKGSERCPYCLSEHGLEEDLDYFNNTIYGTNMSEQRWVCRDCGGAYIVTLRAVAIKEDNDK
jgi:transposase-like protein